MEDLLWQKNTLLSFLAGILIYRPHRPPLPWASAPISKRPAAKPTASVKSKSLESTGGKVSGYGFRAGLIFETCAACDSDFSYRLKLGGGMARADLLSKIDYNGFYMSHTFAFAAVKNDYVKFWIGPQIGFSYRRGSSDRLLHRHRLARLHVYGRHWHPGIPLLRLRHLQGAEQVQHLRRRRGPSFGVNLNLGDYVTLGIEAGVKYGYNIGSQDRELYYRRQSALIPYNRFKGNRLTEHGIEGYGSFAFMFRFTDTYQ